MRGSVIASVCAELNRFSDGILREQFCTTTDLVPEFVFHEDYLERLRTPENSTRLDGAIARGREYGAIEAAEYALASEPAPAEAAAAAPTLTVGSASDEAGEVAAL